MPRLWLPVVDEHTRECQALLVGRSPMAADVVVTPARVVGERGPGIPDERRRLKFVAGAVKGSLAETAVAPGGRKRLDSSPRPELLDVTGSPAFPRPRRPYHDMRRLGGVCAAGAGPGLQNR